ncbi:MAG TPA: radical SAM protein [Deltaproteobacteria bacterium]|nr:radical SAM protein [Deltaproteobacteria bacterium]
MGAAVIHRGEEPPLVAGAGSGAVFFTGCPMRCLYCQNRTISQLCRGKRVSQSELARIMVGFERDGCSTVNLVSPTHYTPLVLESLALARSFGLTLPVVVNSSGYETKECLSLWARERCIFLVDVKYGDNATGRMLSGVDDYWDVVRDAVAYLYDVVGPLRVDARGRAIGGLLVRHLVLPGMRSNPFAVLEFLAGLSTGIPVSVMSQYNPAFYVGDIHDMRRTLDAGEYRVVLEKACELGIETLFVQDPGSHLCYNPDFESPRPFEDAERVL